MSILTCTLIDTRKGSTLHYLCNSRSIIISCIIKPFFLHFITRYSFLYWYAYKNFVNCFGLYNNPNWHYYGVITIHYKLMSISSWLNWINNFHIYVHSIFLWRDRNLLSYVLLKMHYRGRSPEGWRKTKCSCFKKRDEFKLLEVKYEIIMINNNFYAETFMFININQL